MRDCERCGDPFEARSARHRFCSKDCRTGKAPDQPATFAGAVGSGDRRLALEALRDRLAAEIEETTGGSVAALAKQLRDVLADLDALPTGKEVSAVDEIAKRRADRRAKPAV